MSIQPYPYNSSASLGLGQQPIEYPGQFARSRNLAAGEPIKLGRAVGRKGISGEDSQKAMISDPALALDFTGVSAASTDAKDYANHGYREGDPFTEVAVGYVNVYVEEDVTPNDPVRIRVVNHASDATKLKGNFAKTAEANKTVLVKGARWESGTVDNVATLFLSDYTELVADV